MELVLDMRNPHCVKHNERREGTDKDQSKERSFCEKLLSSKFNDQKDPDTDMKDTSREEEDH